MTRASYEDLLHAKEQMGSGGKRDRSSPRRPNVRPFPECWNQRLLSATPPANSSLFVDPTAALVCMVVGGEPNVRNRPGGAIGTLHSYKCISSGDAGDSVMDGYSP